MSTAIPKTCELWGNSPSEQSAVHLGRKLPSLLHHCWTYPLYPLRTQRTQCRASGWVVSLMCLCRQSQTVVLARIYIPCHVIIFVYVLSGPNSEESNSW